MHIVFRLLRAPFASFKDGLFFSLALLVIVVGLPVARAATPDSTSPAIAQSSAENVAVKFVTHQIDDRTQGIPFGVMRIPEGWQMESEIKWNYADVSQPVIGRSHIWNPQAPEELTTYPRAAFYWLQGAAAFNRPGERALGQVCMQPMSPAQTLRNAILQLYRADRRDLQIIGLREMPELAAALKNTTPNLHGIGIKVSYTDRGAEMEEEFYALHYLIQIPYDGPQGHSLETDWGLESVHSFRAAKGTLDGKRAMFAFMMKSIRVNPQWKQRLTAIQTAINQQFNANLAAGYAQIQAAGQLSRQISANNDAMIANMDRQRAASNSAGRPSGPSAGRSSNDNFDDYIRGVDTVNDPYYGTSQHSSTEQYHWTDGYGNYQHSNDASFDPNQRANVSWQAMTSAR